ncbi:MAG: type II secretion system F family protein [Micrococcales bacterium]|nr:type II secretion system F family protein [Micrococcales bacterium]
MEAGELLAGIAFVSAFFAAGILAPRLFTSVRRRLAVGRAHAQLVSHNGLAAALLRNGIPQLRPLGRLVLASKKATGFFTRMQQTLGQRSYLTSPLSLSTVYCTGVLALGAAGWALSASPVIGAVCAVGTVLITAFVLARAQEKRVEAMREAIPDALSSMSVCSYAGFSLLQTFTQVAKEVEEPLRSLFLSAVHDLETGRTATEALDALKAGADVTELAFVAVALDVQHRAGGSLQQVLEAARDSVESELALKRSLRVQTAQAKLSSRIVSVMPFILVALFSFISPGFLAPFFSGPVGFLLLGLAVVMQVAGVLLVRRMLNVGID